MAGHKFQDERKIQNESIREKSGMAASRSSHRLAHPRVGNSQSACLRGCGRTGVAGAIAIIALVAIGVTLVFGGEWNEFARRAVYAVCAIAFIISAAALLGGLFAVGAAVV